MVYDNEECVDLNDLVSKSETSAQKNFVFVGKYFGLHRSADRYVKTWNFANLNDGKQCALN